MSEICCPECGARFVSRRTPPRPSLTADIDALELFIREQDQPVRRAAIRRFALARRIGAGREQRALAALVASGRVVHEHRGPYLVVTSTNTSVEPRNGTAEPAPSRTSLTRETSTDDDRAETSQTHEDVSRRRAADVRHFDSAERDQHTAPNSATAGVCARKQVEGGAA